MPDPLHACPEMINCLTCTARLRCATPGRENTSMSTEPRSDQDTSLTLMMRVQRDPADPKAWDEFVYRYRPMIEAWCRTWGLQASDVDDVTQDVLLKLLAAIKRFQYDSSRSFRSWLKTVTTNALTDFVRARRRMTSRVQGQVEQLAESPDAMADLERKLEGAFDQELLDLAMSRVEKRVKPRNWQAFRSHRNRGALRRRGRRPAPDAGRATVCGQVARAEVPPGGDPDPPWGISGEEEARRGDEESRLRDRVSPRDSLRFVARSALARNRDRSRGAAAVEGRRFRILHPAFGHPFPTSGERTTRLARWEARLARGVSCRGGRCCRRGPSGGSRPGDRPCWGSRRTAGSCCSRHPRGSDVPA